jgi:hypothetical protein
MRLVAAGAARRDKRPANERLLAVFELMQGISARFQNQRFCAAPPSLKPRRIAL